MNAKENYDRWLGSPNLDPDLRAEMEQMSEQEITDAFYTNIEFGTAGMRGVMGAGTNRINIHTIRKATAGFAEYIVEAGKEACEAGIAIGYDNRRNSREFAFDSAKVLASRGIRVFVFESLRPTPELSFAVRFEKCFGGIMITASHNPKEYNGYKLYDEKGCQLIPALADAVIAKVNAVEDELSVTADVTPEQEALIKVIGEDVDKEYYACVKSIQLNPDVRKDDVKIVFSPEHGTSNIPVRTILKDCGYTVIPVLEQCDPNPDFANTPTPNPEQPGAYELALKYAEKENADIILVCDPDADRMGVGVKQNGKYELLTGNQSGAVLIEYILSQLTEKGKMPENPVMFNTVVTSDLGEKIAAKYGVATEKTLTGFKFIGEKVAKYEVNHARNYVFGYEESYGSLISPFVRDKDAQQACLMLAEAACYYKAHGKTLSDVLEDAYKEHGYYKETQTSIELKGQAGAQRIKEITAGLRAERLTEIAGCKVIRWQDFDTFEEGTDEGVCRLEGFTKSDVLKYFLADGSWIAVRPSGTEPKIKVYYCIHGDSAEDAEKKCAVYEDTMKKLTA
ncbi:MAG: phospho-sugar mutase [Solobacterium sp.]|nr:phospho-sugar mutase [Solobacterium sp.]